MALGQEHVARSRAEPGCVAHAVHQDAENPQRLVFVERQSSREALWEHFKVPASRAFAKALAGFATAVPSIELFEASEIAIPGRIAS